MQQFFFYQSYPGKTEKLQSACILVLLNLQKKSSFVKSLSGGYIAISSVFPNPFFQAWDMYSFLNTQIRKFIGFFFVYHPLLFQKADLDDTRIWWRWLKQSWFSAKLSHVFNKERKKKREKDEKKM